jgi:hypothetical protein
MQIGIDSFGAVIPDPVTGLTVSALQRINNLLDVRWRSLRAEKNKPSPPPAPPEPRGYSH